MKQAVIRLQLLLLSLAAVGCSTDFFNRPSIFSDTPTSVKEILINNERYDKPHDILGPVQYTLRKDASLFVDQVDLRSQAIDYLKLEALARYGKKADAIENVQVQENTVEGANGKLSITQVKGIAVSFLPEPRVYSKPRSRSRSAKNPVYKYRPPLVHKDKHPPSDVTITPSEILK